MKKILVSIICVLTTCMVCAQERSENEAINLMLESQNDLGIEAEQALKDLGIRSKIRAYFDKRNNELVFNYQFFSEQIFEAFDLEVGKNGAISAMISEILNQEESGDALEWFTNEFKRTNTGIRIMVVYEEQVKSILVTSTEIQRIASLLY